MSHQPGGGKVTTPLRDERRDQFGKIQLTDDDRETEQSMRSKQGTNEQGGYPFKSCDIDAAKKRSSKAITQAWLIHDCFSLR
jgi:hypothetical protein